MLNLLGLDDLKTNQLQKLENNKDVNDQYEFNGAKADEEEEGEQEIGCCRKFFCC